jgi:Suppressor of forked protein (Suf)
MRTVGNSSFLTMFVSHNGSFLVLDARALFERVITTFPPDRGRPLWERWARYAYQYGDLEATQKLEKRIAEAYPSGA